MGSAAQALAESEAEGTTSRAQLARLKAQTHEQARQAGNVVTQATRKVAVLEELVTAIKQRLEAEKATATRLRVRPLPASCTDP